MPIRINLLAEEQAAEEMRRRDPIKRTLFAGAALTVLMLGWIGITQMSVMAARRELTQNDNRLQKIEDDSKELRGDQRTVSEIQGKVESLQKYSHNRFFWGTLLDAVQQVTVENVRLVEIRADQKHASSEPHKFFSTNLNLTYTPPPARWKVWASKPPVETLDSLVAKALASVTNNPPFTTNHFEYDLNIKPKGTNANLKRIVAEVEFTNPAWSKEETIIEIRGRDYGTPSGAAIDEFARRITASPYFKELLVPVEGFRFTERPPQPRPDPQDPVNPNALFVPFTIQLTLKHRIFTNE